MTGHPNATPATLTASPRQRIMGLVLRGDVSCDASGNECVVPFPRPLPSPVDGCIVVSVDDSLFGEFHGFAGACGPLRVMIMLSVRVLCAGYKSHAPGVA